MSSGILAIVGVFLLGLLAGCDRWGGDDLNQSIPFTTTAFDQCTDELVAVEGNLHTTFRLTVSGDRVHTGVTVPPVARRGGYLCR